MGGTRVHPILGSVPLLHAYSLSRWELQYDTPGNSSNFQKASEAGRKEREGVGEEDKEILESLSVQHYHGYQPKSQAALLDLKLCVTSKSSAAS